MTILTKLLTPSSRPVAKNSGANAYQAVAEAVGTLRQYQDVPVRFRRQWITAFLAAIVLLTIVAGLYLSVASRTAITGREIQGLQADIRSNQRINADLETSIAMLLSSESLKSRAETEGYVVMENADLDYMVVPGYYPPAVVNMVPQAAPANEVELAPEYTESLFTWLDHQLEAASLPLAQDH